MRVPFKFDKEAPRKPSAFEVIFIVDGVNAYSNNNTSMNYWKAFGAICAEGFFVGDATSIAHGTRQ